MCTLHVELKVNKCKFIQYKQFIGKKPSGIKNYQGGIDKTNNRGAVLSCLLLSYPLTQSLSSLSLRGAVCVACGPAGAPTEARWQVDSQMPEQEHQCRAGGQANAEPYYQAGFGLSPWRGHRLATVKIVQVTSIVESVSQNLPAFFCLFF